MADGAAVHLGMDEAARSTVRLAGLLHDVGRVGVSSSIWDRPGSLGPGDWSVCASTPYWTSRILARCPLFEPLATVAGADHERLDGSGYHRGAHGSELPLTARVLAAADAFAAMTEDRPHRSALAPADAAAALVADAAAGRLDPEAVGAVVEAAGLPRRRAAWPCDLIDREVEVLRLAARGLGNREIADTSSSRPGPSSTTSRASTTRPAGAPVPVPRSSQSSTAWYLLSATNK